MFVNLYQQKQFKYVFVYKQPHFFYNPFLELSFINIWHILCYLR